MSSGFKAMILAAGAGTRLRPLTANLPKPMLPVAGRPVLEYTIAWLRYYEVRQVAINLHHCPEAVIDYFGDGSAFGVRITYSVEEVILGTAGGVKRLAHFFEEPFILIYGDVLTDLDLNDLIRFHISQPSTGHMSMTVHRVPNPSAGGVVELDKLGRVTCFMEKPAAKAVRSNLVNAGILIINPEILEYIPSGQFFDFGQDLFPRLLQVGVPIYAWPLPETAFLLDIGTPENYAQTQEKWPTPRARLFFGEERR